MNKYVAVIIVLLVAVVAMSLWVAYSPKPAETAVDNIMTRTSIRAYQDKPVEQERVEALLRAAMAAPTARNMQPWKFIVVTDKELLQQIADTINTMTMAAHAPLAIVVCGDLNEALPGEGNGYWVQDASAATENLLLAAHAMGLGAVWCGVYPKSERVAFISRLLELPASIVPLNVIPIGYPAESPNPKDKWKPEKIHLNKWGNIWQKP